MRQTEYKMVMNQSNKIVTLGEMNAMASRAGSSPEVMMSPGVDELFSLQLGGPGTQMAILPLIQLPCCPASLCDLTINNHYIRHMRMSFLCNLKNLRS